MPEKESQFDLRQYSRILQYGSVRISPETSNYSTIKMNALRLDWSQWKQCLAFPPPILLPYEWYSQVAPFIYKVSRYMLYKSSIQSLINYQSYPHSAMASLWLPNIVPFHFVKNMGPAQYLIKKSKPL
ncbi:hypothetical protein ACTFIW_010312 [Dictyostelium discoideum]